MAIERGDQGWRVAAPPTMTGPTDDAVIADVLGALQLAAASRWGTAADAARVAADPGAVVVTIDAARGEGGAGPGGSWTLTTTAPDDATGLAWVTSGAGRAALVEAWVVRAIDRPVDALRRRVVVTTARPTGIEVHADGVELVLSGEPLAAHLPDGIARLAPAAAAALVDALAALRLVTVLPPTPAAARPGTIRVLGGNQLIEIEDLGACPGTPAQHAVGGTVGTGCVDGAAWARVIDAARAIATAPAAAVDPSPLVDADVERLVLADGASPTPRGGDWQLEAPAGAAAPTLDATRVRALLAALVAPGRVVATAAPARAAATATATATATVTYAGGHSHTIAVVDATHLRRGDEPFAIEVPAASVALLRAGAGAVRDHTVLAEDPFLLRQVDVVERGATVSLIMGDTFEAWTASRGVAEPAALGALRDLMADLVADELLGGAAVTPRRTLTLQFAAPPVADATATTHTLRLAAPGADGRCRATIDDAAALLPASACRTLLAPLHR